LVAAGIAAHDTPTALAGGALTAGTPLLQALRDDRSTERDIRLQPFYFLYGVERALA
jgi:hypothetical protein